MLITAALAFAAAALAAPPPGATAIGPGVVLIRGAFIPGQQPDGNTVVFRGNDSLLVVDTGRHASHTKKIAEYAESLRLPVAIIVNTHWHLDHTGGNALLRREFPHVRVYASGALAEARKGFLASYRDQLQNMVRDTSDPQAKETYATELQLVENAAALEPDVVVTKTQRLDFGGNAIEVHLEERAVTGGDLWLEDTAHKLVVAGDLVTLPVPFLDTACPSRWSAALDRLSQVRFKTLVPGHGAPMSRSEFETYRKAYRNLVACAASSSAKAVCIDGWMNDAAPLLTNDKPEFVRSLLDYYVGAVLRGDPATIRQRCGE